MTTSKRYEILQLKVGDLTVDPNVQRALQKARVAAMADKFDPDALGTLTASQRTGGIKHVVDGQHRYRAAELAKYDGAFDVKLYHGLTVPEEAALFRVLNTARQPSAIDHFLIACVEQDIDALRLANFMKANGWSVGAYSAQAKITAIGSLQRVYARSPEGAAATLAVVTKAWGHIPAAVNGALLEGLGRFLTKHGPDVDLNDLAARLAGYPGGPASLMGNARGQKITHTGSLNSAVARIMTGIYNERRRSTKLPEWV
jgi:hypothetical protein